MSISCKSGAIGMVEYVLAGQIFPNGGDLLERVAFAVGIYLTVASRTCEQSELKLVFESKMNSTELRDDIEAGGLLIYRTSWELFLLYLATKVNPDLPGGLLYALDVRSLRIAFSLKLISNRMPRSPETPLEPNATSSILGCLRSSKEIQ